MSRAAKRFDTRARRRHLAVALACTACTACAGSERGPSFPTSTTFPEARRRPPSFATESPGSHLLAAVELAEVSTQGDIQRLEVPLDPEQGVKLVRAFFDAVLIESSEELFPLFAAQAWAVSEGNRQPAQASWRTRFAQLEYQSLSGRMVAPRSALRTYTEHTAARARADGLQAPAADEVVVVAKLSLSWAGRARLFGDRLVFKLRPRPDGTRFEIAEIAEDFKLP